ncbi:MAG: M14 family metallopeptidase [Alphaproteobacteria bacterium]|tara:strand:- start:1186 stop:2346 length:1161 start_codon:yes stop_codon:yes gene_type:complete
MRKILFFIIIFFISPLFASNPDKNKECSSDIVKIEFNFPGAGSLSCEVIKSDYIKIYINPEIDDSINPSPWFAIRKSEHSKSIKLELDYKNYKHRYYPKLSKDKKKWTKIDEIFISKKEDGKIVIIDFLPSNQKEYVASQELITDFWYDEWYNELESSGRVKREIIGFSVLRNPIHMFFAEKNTNNPYILVLGRQHPPEVTGALAMKSFINELLTENFLTDSFLDRYNILFVPLMNPDGVMNGFWRYNANKKDLNRDWGNFTQPETDAVYKKLIKLSNKKLVLFIDFHSTFKNIFYISDVLEDSSMKHFLRDWLGDSRDSLSEINYSYEIINSLNKDNGVSKNYIYNKYKIPSVTYEVSDNENRNIIQQSSSVLATNLMKLLLKIE